jgi:hypothetical protein
MNLEQVNTTSSHGTSTETVEALQQRIGRLDPQQIRAWRAMLPHERLAVAFQAYQFVLDAVRVTEQQRYPDLPPDELNWRVTRRIQGNPRLGK